MPQDHAAALPADPLPTAPFVKPMDEAMFSALLLDAFQIANESVIADIQSEAHPVNVDGLQWWDTRPMTDAARHAPQSLALNNRSIAYAINAAQVGIHPQRPYLVHILNQA